MSRVLAAPVSVASKPVEQAVQHYSRTWLIAAVAAELAARASATLDVLVLSRVRRYLMPGNDAMAAERVAVASARLAAYGVLAAPVSVASKPVEQAVQHYSRTWLIAAVAAELAARASATLAVLVLSRVRRHLMPGNDAMAAEKVAVASARLAAYGVLAAAAPVAAEPVEQAVQHYPRTWLIAAVPANVAARAALLLSWASATLVARSARHRLSALLQVLAADSEQQAVRR